MGEVYRARDTRLGREVAIKVLPAEVSSSETWRKRFEREAKAISKLAHPHVCALFDVGRHGDVDYLVMELLAGETLATRLAEGPLPFDEALHFGAQIASALSATHAMGIAHGDLKPGNIMLTNGGVKLLDYGVARPLLKPVPRDATWESTVSQIHPQGEVVGTFPYMAPEQFDGKAADAHTDVFALGAVLFEMASGKRAFPGSTQAEVISAIRTAEPPTVSSLQPVSPPAFDRLVRTCLTKHPGERWDSAHDVGLLLRQMSANKGDLPVAEAAPHRWAFFPWALALAALCVASAVVLRPKPDAATSATPLRFLLAAPLGHAFFWYPEADPIAVSPDGSQVAFIAVNSKGEQRLWLRRMNDLESRLLPTTDGAISVFWSPDGRSLGFFADGMLKRLDLSSDAAIKLASVDTGEPGPAGTWGTHGDILFSAKGKIMRVSATGGTPSVEIVPDTAHGEAVLRYPTFLPDGERFLYLAGPAGNRVAMLVAPNQRPQKLMPVGSKVQFSEPGFLVFSREGSLLAQRFDWRSGKLSGAPWPIAPRVRGFISAAAAEYSTSLNGTLVLQSADDVQRLAVVDQNGHELETLSSSSGQYFDFAISRSGTRVAFSRATPGIGTADVWSFDVERGVETRLTTAIDNELKPLWLPGEKGLVYSSSEGGQPHLVRRNLETGLDTQLLPIRSWQLAQDVSPDGSAFLYTEADTVWRFPLSSTGDPSPVLKADISNVRFSPDGQYVAFISEDSGQSEAYVTPYPGPGERRRISSSGAISLQWHRGTGTLFYSDVEGQLWSVAVSTQPALRIGNRTALFAAKSLVPRRATTGPMFDVFPDGQRILVAGPAVTANELPLTVVVNWPASAPN